MPERTVRRERTSMPDAPGVGRMSAHDPLCACIHSRRVDDEAGAHEKCSDCGAYLRKGDYDAFVASQGGIVDGPPIEGEGDLL